eukprot:26640-Chlamydomonas_euryale.AAC.1
MPYPRKQSSSPSLGTALPMPAFFISFVSLLLFLTAPFAQPISTSHPLTLLCHINLSPPTPAANQFTPRRRPRRSHRTAAQRPPAAPPRAAPCTPPTPRSLRSPAPPARARGLEARAASPWLRPPARQGHHEMPRAPGPVGSGCSRATRL